MDGLLNEGAAQLEALTEVTPDFLAAFLILSVALAAALVLHWLLHRFLIRFVAPRDLFWRSLVARTTNALRLAFAVGGLALAAPLAPLPETVARILHHVLLIGFIAIVMRLAQLAMHIFTTLHLRRFKLDAEDELLARKHVTQMRILQRIAGMLILILGIGAMLMTFDTVRQYGISLLASAGAAGIVVGLALQPMLKNLFAGIQLAVTQPIRIDDALVVEGEYGNVEEITSTYVVVRAWDRRRLIIPLNYFIERPFQNWTRDETALIGVVFFYVDFSVPVAVLRKKAEEIVRASPLWDGETFAVQVTDLRETTMEVRVLASGADSGDVFSLKCDIREQLIAFLATNYPQSLPRFRAETDASEAPVRQPAFHYEANPEGGRQ
ncbi:mechanosensitive ion channel family protein [Chelativorans salis]|uniref:Mechanosensitive ion channel family protein n=1 Tax=Chelativorans salis TaxID=2978478 RepID=A0ABT2LSP2_9HYPH|nr:mechanosensitive ion channel family protein [Chelativorans sp. EGI FJ00035]MCT7377499.1 mechanosensitive ion channel family protein [Chelativorans sp. EGI FJ00035]